MNLQEQQLVSSQLNHDFMPIIMDITQEQEIQNAFELIKNHASQMKFRALIRGC